MARKGEFHAKWKPRGVCDTIDGDNVAPGSMTSLSNLLPDPSTPGSYICRSANTKLINFSAWAAKPGTTGVVPVAFQIDNIIYGMVGITSGSYVGKDYPFAYNTVTGAFLAVTGPTVANCPTSQATSGAWTPPVFTLTSIKLVLTHVGYDGVTHFFGVFDLTLPTSPTYTAQNTTTNALPSVPQAAQTFSNRTYFFCGNVAYYTDTLTFNMANSDQSFTLGDLTPVTAAAPLPVSTTSQGIVQGILAFKLTQVFLITGDVVLSDLSVNLLSPSVGTAAPRSVVPTPEGVPFMANDGIRNINFFGVVSPPNADLAMPFIYAVTPSRVCAAFNSDVYRICVQNGNAVSSPFQDWWYNIHFKGWTGPHSFPYDTIVTLSNDFVLASNTLPGFMWNSDVVQGHAGTGNTFIENGAQLSWLYETTPMTDLDNIYANSVERTTLDIAVPAEGQTYNFTAQDENGTVLATASLTESSSEAIWGSFNWGEANWGAATSGLLPNTIPWNQAVVFNKYSFMAAGPSSLGLRIGSLHNAYKRLKYLLN